MSDTDETIVAYLGATRLDGGGGFDILDFGDLQGWAQSIYNSPQGSGGQIRLTDPSTSRSSFVDYVNFEGFRGSPHADDIMGNARTTFIDGAAGADTLSAQVMDTPYAITIFGGEGNDSIGGSEMGDLVNGNTGDDIVHGWERDDRLYGGQNNDVIYGDDGDDFAHGNLGNDTVEGGSGADTLLGGKADDVLQGGTGNDYLSGDLGDDTVVGGEGADTFHLAAGGGADRVTDYNAAAGDQVKVDAGSTYTLAQSGGDTVITFAAGGSAVLAGVALASLSDGWIVEA